jgi:hypothetical protein
VKAQFGETKICKGMCKKKGQQLFLPEICPGSLTLSLGILITEANMFKWTFLFFFDKVRHFLSKFSTLVTSQKSFFCTF